ncbi:MAG: hypothetical protein WCI95_06910 [bacterium]
MAGSQIKIIGFGAAILALGILGVVYYNGRHSAYAQAHELSMQNMCRNNLRMLDMALEQAALSLNYKEGNTVTESEISPFLKGGFSGLVCPKNGHYTIHPVGKESECSVHGSVSTMKPKNKPVANASVRAAANARSDAMYEEAVREGMRVDNLMAVQSAQTAQKKSTGDEAAKVVAQENQSGAGQKAETEKCVYFMSGNSLYRLGLDSRATSIVCSGLPKITNLIMDGSNNRLLLATWDSGSSILSVDPTKGHSPEVRAQGPGQTGGQGLAYDEATSNLFLGLYYNGVYAFNNHDVQGWRQIVTASSLSPMIGQRGQLVLNPASRHVFFRSTFNGSCNQCRYIWRVNYDGSGLTKIIQANGGDALAIDPVAGHLYFTDEPGEGTVKRVNLDGTGVITILSLKAPYGVCIYITLDVPANKIYYFLAENDSWKDKTIARSSMNGADFEILTKISDTAEGWGIAVYSPAPQPKAPEPKVLEPKKIEPDTATPPQDMHRIGAIACFVVAAGLVVLLIFLMRQFWRVYKGSFG